MNYYQYTAEDFAADDYFQEWVSRPSAHTDKFWQAFLVDYPERYYQVEEARRLITGLQKLNENTVSDQQVNQVWSRIEESLFSNEKITTVGWLKIHGWKLAAMLVLCLGMGWWLSGTVLTPQLITTQSPSKSSELAWKEAINEGTQLMDLQLPDGSRIELEKNSTLRYPAEFSEKQREVYLTGKAFFDIQKNPNKPFLVHANGLVTKVLGTSFFIDACKEAPSVTVSVKTGRVSVFTDTNNPERDHESEGVVLTPNQKAIFQRKEATISKTIVENPSLLIPETQKSIFAFDTAPTHQVFEALEKAYGIEVVFDEELLKGCSLTLNLTEENLYQKLEVICKVLGAEYKLIDGQVIIYSRGC